MATKIFINLPFKNLQQSIAFFTQLGFTFNPQFTDDTATCMIVGDDIFVMLLTHDKFKTFTPKPICDATKNTEVLVCLSRESRAKVDEMVRDAVAAGGTTYNDPHDHGFMCSHRVQPRYSHMPHAACTRLCRIPDYAEFCCHTSHNTPSPRQNPGKAR